MYIYLFQESIKFNCYNEFMIKSDLKFFNKFLRFTNSITDLKYDHDLENVGFINFYVII